jgi:hypothetical protein
MDDDALAGGIGTVGLVVRVGDTVRRPWLRRRRPVGPTEEAHQE